MLRIIKHNIWERIFDKLNDRINPKENPFGYYYRGKNNIRLEENQTAVNDFNKVIEICDNNNNLKNKYIEEYCNLAAKMR